MNRNFSAVLLAAAISITGGISGSYAGVVQLSGPSQLGAADSTFTDPDAPGTTYTGPLVSFTDADNTLTWSRGSGPFESVVAAPCANADYFSTAFAGCTSIFQAGGFLGAGDGGPVTLTFATGVRDFGVNIEEFANGPYTVAFTVYNGAAALGTFSASGSDPDGGFASILSFEGAAATGGGVITSVVFDDSAAGGPNNLGFGPVTYGDATATPEPATASLFGLGLAVVALIRRRRSA